jgi:hypothetical protein
VSFASLRQDVFFVKIRVWALILFFTSKSAFVNLTTRVLLVVPFRASHRKKLAAFLPRIKDETPLEQILRCELIKHFTVIYNAPIEIVKNNQKARSSYIIN